MSVINQTAVWVKSHSLAHDGFFPAACFTSRNEKGGDG